MIYRQLPVEAALEKMRAAGYDALELWPRQFSEFRTPALRRRLRDKLRADGIELIRLNCADCDYFQSLPSSRDVETALEGLKRHIDEAADYGMRQVLTWEGRRPENASDPDVHGPILDRTVDLFRAASDYAGERGIELSVEVHPFTLGINLDWLIAFCDRLESQAVSVTYDCCHFAVGLPEAYVQAIERLGRRIGHVHFSDSDCKSSELHFAPGTGSLDLDGIVEALARIKFRGTMMLDLWLYPLPDEGTKIGVPYVCSVCERLGLA